MILIELMEKQLFDVKDELDFERKMRMDLEAVSKTIEYLSLPIIFHNNNVPKQD